MPWTIYKHTHVASGRCYVGITSRTMARRWREHVRGASKGRRGARVGSLYCPRFHAAIAKYGADSFTGEVLQTCDTREDANAAEQHWIAALRSNEDGYGFNLDAGGTVHATHPETRRKVSAANKARFAAMTTDERAAFELRRVAGIRAFFAAMAPAEKRAHGNAGRQAAHSAMRARSPDERSVRAASGGRGYAASLTAEEHRANMARVRAGRTEESYRKAGAAISAAAAARRANIAAACPAPSLRFNLLASRVQPAAVAPAVPAVLPAPPVLPEPSRPLVQLPLFAA